MFILVIALTSALEIIEIPQSGTYQPIRTRVASVYDPIFNQILTFGGFDFESQRSLLYLTSFNLTSRRWAMINPQSDFLPPRLSFPRLFLRKDRKILTFFGSLDSGQSPNVYSYNLLTDNWALETLGGDIIQGMSRFGFASFVYNDINFVACFGGVRKDQISSDLFIINTDTLIARKIKVAGSGPGAKVGASLVYYNKKLYLFGGNWPIATSQADSELYAFSLETETWSIVVSNTAKPLPRTYHYSYVYNSSMYLLYGSNENSHYDEAWRFDFVTSGWSSIQLEQGHLRIFAGDVQVNNKVYLLFGEDIQTKTLNSIDSYELDTQVKISEVVGKWVSPIARKNHCSQIISKNIYVLGGISDSGEPLNDMWTYNIDTGVWTSVPALGDVFTPRYSFACIKIVGTGLVIFGGTDSNNVFNDIYYLEGLYNYWIKIEFPTTSLLANPRYNSCLSYLNYYAFLFGGQDNRRGYSDLWLYNYLTKITYLLTPNLLTFTLINHKCWGEVVNNDYIIYIAGGTTYERLANKKVFKVIVKESTYTFNITEVFESELLAVSNPAFVTSDNEIYMLFGTFTNYVVSNKIVAYNFRTNELTSQEIPTAYISTGSSAVQFGKNFYVFGGGLTSNGFALHSSYSSFFYKLTPDKSKVQSECSPGTHGDNCEPCPLGTFGYSQMCVPCPAGRYSTSIAADSFIFCIPCDYNSFSPDPGSLRCLDCPSNMFCPIAATKPRNIISIIDAQSNQPVPYNSNTSFVNSILNQIMIYFIIFALLLTTIVISSNYLWESIKKVDMFSNSHEQKLDVPVTYRVTSIGGLFTLFFLLTAIIVFLGSVLTYVLDNISETRSLVPVSTLDNTIVADKLIVEVNLLLYGGTCVVNDECYNYISVTESGIDFETKTNQCELKDDNCLLRITYEKFTLLGDSQIDIQYLDVFAFAIAMVLNVSVSSSIPNQMSNVIVPIVTSSPLEIFRGITPTVINFEFTPTVFTSESGQWPSESTGYHIIDNKEIVLGAVATQQTMNRNGYLMLRLGMNIAGAGFVVSRLHITGLSLFLGSLVGTILGLIGTFATIMSMFETTVDKGYFKIKRKITLANILSKRKVQSSNFINEGDKVKVHPYLNESRTFDVIVYY